MSVAGNGTACGLPKSLDIPRNDTAFYINFIFLSAVNGSCAVFAFFSNLAIILTVIKVPSLKKRSNTLLCSLAFADCLTGILTQPAFIAWRFFLRSAPNSCSNQLLFLNVYQFFNALSIGLSFVNVVIISFDRHYAISRPLEYAARATQGGKCLRPLYSIQRMLRIKRSFNYPSYTSQETDIREQRPSCMQIVDRSRLRH